MSRGPNLARVLLLATLLSAAIVAVLFGLATRAVDQADGWIEQGVVLTRGMQMQIRLALFWNKFWWVYTIMITGLCMGSAFLYWMIRSGKVK